MVDLYLRFTTKEQAVQVLSERFEDWDGVKTPYSSKRDTLVIATEIPKVDGDGNVLPTTWSGFHVNLRLVEDYNNEYEDYKIEPLTPSTTWL